MSKSKSMWNLGEKLLLKGDINDRNLARLYSTFTNLALNRFVWEGLPEGVESRYIERALFEYGQCCFYDDSNVGLLCLPSMDSNNINVYGEPTHVVLHGVNYSKQVKMQDVARVLNNDLAFPSIHTVNYYVEKIYQIDKTMEKNLKKIKTPYIVGTTKQNELTMKNLVKKIENDEDEMFIDEKLTNGGDVGVHVLKTDTPYYIDKLQQHKNDLMCEFLTVMGLNNSNANNSKKERLLVDEVNVNNGEILMHLDVDYKNRKNACKLINEKFGLNIDVKKNIDLLSQVYNKGSENNGQIHNRTIFPFTR